MHLHSAFVQPRKQFMSTVLAIPVMENLSHLQLESERQTFEAARYRAGEAKGKFKSVVRKWPKQAPRMTYSYFNTHT